MFQYINNILKTTLISTFVDIFFFFYIFIFVLYFESPIEPWLKYSNTMIIKINKYMIICTNIYYYVL